MQSNDMRIVWITCKVCRLHVPNCGNISETVQNAIRYDTIRYIYVRSKADKMAGLVWRTVQKQKKLKKKTKNKKRLARKKRCRQKF